MLFSGGFLAIRGGFFQKFFNCLLYRTIATSVVYLKIAFSAKQALVALHNARV